MPGRELNSRRAPFGPIKGFRLAIPTELFRKAGKTVDRADTVLIVSHHRPDGDATGTTVAVRDVLRRRGKHVVAATLDPVPQRYQTFVAGEPLELWDPDVHPAQAERSDVVIVLDTAAWPQLVAAEEALRRAGDRLIVVDHHETQDALGGIHLIDRTAAATGLIVYEWFGALKWTMPRNALEGLFSALATDTGWFRFSNADARAFRVASEMVEAGVPSHEMYERIYWSESPARIRLTSRALSSLEFHAQGRLAVMCLDQAAFAECGAEPSDSEDLINEPMRIGSVELSVLLIEQPDGRTRVSLRSKGQVNVAAVAGNLGGGGHARAAGLHVPLPLPAAREKMIELLVAELA